MRAMRVPQRGRSMRFFFQAEDGIRDGHVTGVQTCALPILEFWNGWFDHWGEEHHERTGGNAAGELADLLEHGMSVNFYMAHGGTNFGLRAGANHDGKLQPTTTSYDYDAPIAETGQLPEKVRASRRAVAR